MAPFISSTAFSLLLHFKYPVCKTAVTGLYFHQWEYRWYRCWFFLFLFCFYLKSLHCISAYTTDWSKVRVGAAQGGIQQAGLNDKSKPRDTGFGFSTPHICRILSHHHLHLCICVASCCHIIYVLHISFPQMKKRGIIHLNSFCDRNGTLGSLRQIEVRV